MGSDSIKKRDLREVVEHQIGDFPENWINNDINETDLAPYIYPDENELKKKNVTAYYFSYFFRWSMLENYNFVKKKIPNFMTHPNKRTTGTFTNFDSLDDKIDCLYYYMQYQIGFGRATRDACRMLQNNQMNRMEAINMARKYDNEFPMEDFDEVLDYLKLNKSEFDIIVDKHRNPEIWKSNLKNQWELINSI